MRIAIVGPSPVPYIRGGIENFMAALYRTINDCTEHTAELIKVPVQETTVMEILQAYWRFSRMNLDHFDLIISSKYPAWMIRHANHVIYLGHRLRGLYDTYPGSPDTEKLWKHSFLEFPGPWIRRLVHYLDNRAISPDRISHAFAFSQTVANRMEYFHPELIPSVAYCSTVREDYFCRSGKHLFTVSRLDPPKRIDLLIQAYREVSSDIPLIIAGTGPQESYLRRIASGDDRICFVGNVSEDELLHYYAEALGVLYIPYQEDLGLITLEAMKSRKPVITVTDSGGPLEFVRDGENGFITEPDTASLTHAMQRLVDDPENARKMGETAAETVAEINWVSAVESLLAPYRFWPSREPRKEGQRRRLMVLVPYPVHPPRSGGPRRVASIYGELSEVYDVWMISVGRHGTEAVTREITPFLHEVSIPISRRHAEKEWALEKSLGVAVTDALLPELTVLTPNIIRCINYFLECSDIAVSSQPYLYKYLRKTARCSLVVHESQNFEWLLKKASMPESDEGQRLLKSVYESEKSAVTEADLILSICREETNQLAREYGCDTSRFFDAPNGVDTQEIQPVSPEQKIRARELLALDDKPVALFMAAWHPPNLEAFRFILETLVPALPEINFLIVGSVRAQYEARVGPLTVPPNCRITGVVDESTRRDVLAASDIGLNPMFSGSGTNLKILEYFAAGLTVISTSLGIRGLKVTPGEAVVVCEPEEFETQVKGLMANPVQRLRINETARQIVKEIYDWKSITAVVIDAIESKIPPVIPPEDVNVAQTKLFTQGWFDLETWENPESRNPMAVRWSGPDAELRIPNLRCRSQLNFRVLGGPKNTELTVFVDDLSLKTETIGDQWTQVKLEIPVVLGQDWRTIRVSSDSWSPADTGSQDTRVLGMAITGLVLEKPS